MALKTNFMLKSIFIFKMSFNVMILYRSRNPFLTENTPYTTTARKCVKTPPNNTCAYNTQLFSDEKRRGNWDMGCLRGILIFNGSHAKRMAKKRGHFSTLSSHNARFF